MFISLSLFPKCLLLPSFLFVCLKVHTADHIVERLDLPSDLIRDASGQVAFEEEAPRVKAVDLDLAFRWLSYSFAFDISILGNIKFC